MKRRACEWPGENGPFLQVVRFSATENIADVIQKPWAPILSGNAVGMPAGFGGVGGCPLVCGSGMHA